MKRKGTCVAFGTYEEKVSNCRMCIDREICMENTLELVIPECVECTWYPKCLEMELDGVFVGDNKKCEE